MTETPRKTQRATTRPPHVKAPSHWAEGSQPPVPEKVKPKGKTIDGRNPVRYGDWELNGIAIDF